MQTKTKHLVVTITGHGYGHAAMTAPLINRLRQRHPHLKITLRSSVNEAFLRNKFQQPFAHRREALDFGLVMHNAFEIDREASLQRYQAFHHHWQENIETERAQLRQMNADFLLSNIAYLPLLAASQEKIPCVAYSCLNWWDIFNHYFFDYPQAKAIQQQILEAYLHADLFIRTEPAMPMNNLPHISVGAIAIQGNERRDYLFNTLKLPADTKLVLASMGGIDTDMNIQRWPYLEGIHYLLLDQPAPERKDITSLVTSTEFSFSDAMRSADLLLTKPGYGSFTEAAFNRTPVLFVNRPDWPEQVYLQTWLQAHLPCREIHREQLISGDFATELMNLIDSPVSSNGPPSGLNDAIALLESAFSLSQ